MEPWILDGADPLLALRLRQTGRELVSTGHYLWDIIGRPEPLPVADYAVFVQEVAGFLGGTGDDILYGSARILDGGAGDDVIFQTSWGFRIHGGEGDDFVAGWSDGIRITGGAGDDTLLGGDGDDELIGGGGDNLLIGGPGDDVLASTSATAWMGGEIAGADWVAAKRLASDEMQGGRGHDSLTGSFGADRLYGGDDDDLLKGNAGDDHLFGGMGFDVIGGDDGDDRIEDIDGPGGDLSGGAGDDVIVSGDGGAMIRGGPGADLITAGMGADRVDGGAGDDVIRLGAGNDRVLTQERFGTGDDVIYGEDGDDRIAGGYGRDALDGGAGDDKLYGGARDDVLTGGAGADRFVLHSVGGIDTITDFAAGDRLEIYPDINGLGLDGPAALAGRAFLGDGFAWIDLEGPVAAVPDGGSGVVLEGVADAAWLSEIIDRWTEIG